MGLLSVVGLAMQTGVVMVVYIDAAFHRRMREGRLQSREDIVAAHAEGTVQRLRPKIMTITTMAAGLLPLLWAEGAGAEIMRRVAAPMIGAVLQTVNVRLSAEQCCLFSTLSGATGSSDEPIVWACGSRRSWGPHPPGLAVKWSARPTSRGTTARATRQSRIELLPPEAIRSRAAGIPSRLVPVLLRLQEAEALVCSP